MNDVVSKAKEDFHRIGGERDILGEVPVWSVGEQTLYWIDVRAPCIRRRIGKSTEVTTFPMPESVGSIALRSGRRGLICGLRSSVGLFDPATAKLARYSAPHAEQANMRFNDGKCDRQGRFWVGSMDDVDRRPVGVLYRFEDGEFTPVLEGIAVPNSLAWSLDGRTMYFSDGIEPVIWAYPFDITTGNLGKRRAFARLGEAAGLPDGATVDAEGFLWSAQYGGGMITRYAPDGRIDYRLPVPVSQPTSCCFGGSNMNALFVTTASQKLSPKAQAREPLAGALLMAHMNVHGVPEPQYVG